MTPSQARSMYGRFLQDRIGITRLTGAVPSQTSTTASDIRARIASYREQELSAAIMQGDQRIIVSKDDLDAASWPVPPKKGDKVTTSDGRTLTVQACDANTRRVGSTLIAYELQARGT